MSRERTIFALGFAVLLTALIVFLPIIGSFAFYGIIGLFIGVLMARAVWVSQVYRWTHGMGVPASLWAGAVWVSLEFLFPKFRRGPEQYLTGDAS